MFFATTAQPQLRRHAYANTGRALERFMDEALRSTAAKSCAAAYTQDDTSYTLSLDVPGVTKEQLSIAIEAATVRIGSKEGASRRYNAAYEFPLEIDTAQSEAKLENGVLTLKLVKKLPVSNATELVVH
jgi:HSP20 family molecular chaperone IbpA